MEKITYRGDEIMLFANGKAMALATSCSLEVTTNTIDARTKDSARGADTEFDNISWTSSSESFVGANKGVTAQTLADDLLDLQIAGQPVTLTFGRITRTSSAMGESGWIAPTAADENNVLTPRTGKAWIKSVSVNAPVEGKSTVSVQFEGIGELTKIGA